MAVRNFWIDASIDGRKTELAGGPTARDGGMYVTIKQRSQGGIVNAFNVSCYEVDGELRTEVIDSNGALVAAFETAR